MDRDITIYLAKARESLQSAESDFDQSRYNSCANRCYYACFQAAIAALRREGISTKGQWKHDYVQAQFVGLLVNRRKVYAGDLRAVLTNIQDLREVADYSTVFVTEAQAGRALRRTRAFVAAVEQQGGSSS